ncbi:eukaryotic translation initiation factor 5A-2 [Xylaria sp. CBS 124048]|nr:eukaryotic translation initiation factor 5A-2 [Xylaria sp. CBS 124048]
MADDEQHNHDFSGAKAETSLTVPQQCSSLRKGGFVVMKGKPCKITDMSTSKTGKHGHAKVHLVGVDIFTEKKYEELCPSTHNMDVPIIDTTTFLLDYVGDDGFLHLQLDGVAKEDIKIPEGALGEELKKLVDDQGEPLEDTFVNVTVKSAMGEEHAVEFKPGNF